MGEFLAPFNKTKGTQYERFQKIIEMRYYDILLCLVRREFFPFPVPHHSLVHTTCRRQPSALQATRQELEEEEEVA